MSDPARTDQNLLFGILALQMDFICRDALVAAMNAWVLEKATPLGLILLRQGSLHADTHALLEALVQKHLEMHDGDAQKSLASVSSLGSVREQLQQIADPDLHASLAHVSANHVAEDPWATRPPSAGTPTSAGLRFRILRPHAKGGLGEVFVARDEEVRREVALKEILNRHADDPNSRARFLREAEITGGLEHPGVVPVYGLGQYADGRPYYAMRFVKGDSLQDAIQRFHRADVSGRDLGERTLALRQLLGRFVDVCDAVAYAHSRGVLHRDLKPGNIMLGQYGETLVVDWGLAKPMAEGAVQERGAEAPLRPSGAADATPTQMGSAIGTPAFMPPEQAAGRLDQLGPASDVYSLGATLYCLLAGRAPFPDQDKGDVLQRVQRGEFPRPREVKRDVPPALEAVCLKAMSLRSEERYAGPRALAADIERWLADESVSAWREPWRLRVGRWTRRHQTLVASAAAGLLVAVLAVGSGAWWLDRQRTEQRRGVEAALAEVTRLEKEGRWSEARAVLGQASDRLGEGGPRDLRERLEQARGELDLVLRLDAIRLRRATLVEGRFDTAGADREYEQAFQNAGMGETGSDEAAAASWVSGSGVREALVAALDDWASCARGRQRRAWLLGVCRRVDPEPWRDAARDPAAWEDAAALTRLASDSRMGGQPLQLLVALGERLLVLGGKSEDLLGAAQERRPGDFWANFLLGNALLRGKRVEQAVGYYRASLALRPGTAVVHNNLGAALSKMNQPDEAIAEFQKAIELDPNYAKAHLNLSLALTNKGRLDEALAEDQKTVELDPKDAGAHTNLGATLHDKGRLDEATAEYQKALELDPKYAKAHHNLGNALRDKGRLDEAIAEYRNAIELDPSEAKSHNSLGLALHDQGRLDEALVECQKAVELDPKLPQARSNLGNALAAKGRLDEAIAQYWKAVELTPKNATVHFNLGAALRAKGRLDEAIAQYRKAIQFDDKLSQAHNNLGNALLAKGRPDEAIAEFQKALELKPKDAHQVHTNLGAALRAKGQLDEAIAQYRKAIEFDHQFAMAHGALGQALLQQGQFAAARSSTQRCLELLPANHPLRQPVFQQLQRCERMLALDQKLADMLKGQAQPADAAEQLGLAELCALKKLSAAAARFYADAFAAQPKLSDDPGLGHRYNAACAAALASAVQGRDATKLDDKECARLRRQALDWLRADLSLWSKQVDKGTPQERAAAEKTLRHWQQDSDLASLRDPAALEKLPPSERAACRKLWNDVAALLKK